MQEFCVKVVRTKPFSVAENKKKIAEGAAIRSQNYEFRPKAEKKFGFFVLKHRKNAQSVLGSVRIRVARKAKTLLTLLGPVRTRPQKQLCYVARETTTGKFFPQYCNER